MFWLIFIVLICLILWKFANYFTYWQRRGIQQISFGQICKGFLQSVYKRQSYTEALQDAGPRTTTLATAAYDDFPQSKFNGTYQLSRPIIIVRDPDLIKQLAVKDFDHFVDHIRFLPEETLWSKSLFGLTGEKWKEMRAILSPAFTSSKMRAMFCLMSDCADDFVKYFEERKTEVLDVELKDIFTRYTNDVIATCAFGVNCNSMRDRENEFYLMGKALMDFSGILKSIKIVFIFGFPKLSKLLGFAMFDPKITKFFKSLILGAVKLREEKNIARPDMINLLMEARKGRLTYEETSATEAGFATAVESDIGKTTPSKQKHEITDDDITAHALGFFVAGFDSVAVLMSFMGYELAVNPEIQERLQQEIDEALEQNGKITYEMVNKLKYLDMVTSETLRKWPGAQATDRYCVSPYSLPSENLSLNKGDALWIPIWGLHRDPKYFPNPGKFDPERFSDENKQHIKPYTYLPFGLGPRNCIGSRFALLEVKLVYIKLLSKFNFVVIEKTPVPMVLAKTGLALSPKKGFWVGLRARN